MVACLHSLFDFKCLNNLYERFHLKENILFDQLIKIYIMSNIETVNKTYFKGRLKNTVNEDEM